MFNKRCKHTAIFCWLLLLLTVAGPAGAQTTGKAASDDALTTQLTAREQTIWKAFATQDLPALRRIFTPDFKFIDADGIISAEDFLPFAAVCQERSWSFDQQHALPTGKDAAVLMYHVTQDSSCHGKQQDAHIYVVTSWEKQRGVWRENSHTELPAKN